MSVLSAPHFHDEEAAYAFVEARVWPEGPICPHCGGFDRISKMGGKSTLGAALAKRLKLPIVQLDALVEEAAGMRLDEVFVLLGQAAFRRLEREALERAVAAHPRLVLETGGGLVAEAETYERLLAACFTVWLRASPAEHMGRVAAQGDFRPMAGNRAAMADLKRILDGRDQLYAKADAQLDTSGRSVKDCVEELAALAAD
jgi:XRE family aerobic/anaerobic benzoate catabolism transcriptional regulator